MSSWLQRIAWVAVTHYDLGLHDELIGEMIRCFGQIRQVGLRILCSLAFLLLGFANSNPTANARSIETIAIASYILPDGSLPDLCLPSEAGKTHHHKGESKISCDACRHVTASILPLPTDTLGAPILREIVHAHSGTDESPPRFVLLTGTSARGPPLRS